MSSTAKEDASMADEPVVHILKSIDIMRTVRSFDPCLPCGVHMYLGKGRVLEKMHSPAMLNTP